MCVDFVEGLLRESVSKCKVATSDGVSGLGLKRETRLETHFCESRSQMFQSRLGLEGCRSRSQAYCLRLLIPQRYGIAKFP